MRLRMRPVREKRKEIQENGIDLTALVKKIIVTKFHS